MARSKRILTLDGGGAWALIEVQALISLYGASARGHDVLAEFDLAASNSGGSLVLGGLLMDIPLLDLAGLFLDEARRRQVFAGGGAFPGRYRAEGKLAGLRSILGATDRAVADWTPGAGNRGRRLPHLLFCAYDVIRQRGHLFRSDLSAPAASFDPGRTATVAEAIHASSDAPILYFDDVARTADGKAYWDGAIAGWNCPAAVAVTEALSYGWAATDIALLSLGTGRVLEKSQPVRPPTNDLGLRLSRVLTEVKWLLSAILKEPANGAPLHAHILLGGALPPPMGAPVTDGPVVRMNPMPVPADAGYAALAALDMDAVAAAEVALIGRLATDWLQNRIRNEPVRMNAATNLEIGQARASDAMQLWQALAPPRIGPEAAPVA